jgi:recombination protein RecA
MKLNYALVSPQWAVPREPERLSSGLAALDRWIGGVPRGAVTQLLGAPSSGRTGVLFSFLAESLAQDECCAYIDACDALDPASAEAAGVDLTRLLWVRCGGHADRALPAADLLLQAGGFGVVVADLSDLDPRALHRVPLSWWHRFRLAVEKTRTALVLVEREPAVRSCATLALEFQQDQPLWSGTHPNFQILRGARLTVQARKPVRPQAVRLELRAVS